MTQFKIEEGCFVKINFGLFQEDKKKKTNYFWMQLMKKIVKGIKIYTWFYWIKVAFWSVVEI